jgi:hypothetical protein
MTQDYSLTFKNVYICLVETGKAVYQHINSDFFFLGCLDFWLDLV